MARVMVVDDAMFMRNMLKTILTPTRHQVVGEACNGIEALREYEICKPDIVTMDITMPEMDGIQAVRAIKEKHPDAKILMCSAMGQQSLVIEAIQAGAMDFIVKPFEKQDVIDRLNTVERKH